MVNTGNIYSSLVRAVEGMIIDIKTRHSAGAAVDAWRPHIDKFLDSVLLTNAFLIYSPSQIALAAIIHAASVHKVNTPLSLVNTDHVTYNTELLLVNTNP